MAPKTGKPGTAKKTNAAGREILAALREVHEAVTTADHSTLTVREVEIDAPGHYDSAAVRRLRNELGVSQRLFAQLLGISPELVEHWEQGITQPRPVARRLLDRISADPAGYLASLMWARPIA